MTRQLDSEIITPLAERLAEIAALPKQKETVERWKRLNGLASETPMVLCLPDSDWKPVTDTDLECDDPLMRSVELEIRSRIYHFEKIRDDWPIHAAVHVPLAWRDSGWGVKPRIVSPAQANGAYRYEPVIVHPSDAEKMTYPEVTVDHPATEELVSRVADVVGGILDVKVLGCNRPPGNPAGIFCTLRGLEQVLMDMLDRPEWLKGVMEFMTQGYFRRNEAMERLGIYTLNSEGDSWVGSGGMGYTDELPATDYEGRVRMRDIWGRCDTQEFTVVSPEHYWEFAMQYQSRILAGYGLTVIGCCEAMDGKYRYLEHFPNARRVSVSPWADMEEAAAALEDKYVYSWRLNPGEVLSAFDEGVVRETLARGLEVAKGCHVEIILNNLQGVFGRPELLGEWCDIAHRVIDDFTGA